MTRKSHRPYHPRYGSWPPGGRPRSRPPRSEPPPEQGSGGKGKEDIKSQLLKLDAVEEIAKALGVKLGLQHVLLGALGVLLVGGCVLAYFGLTTWAGYIAAYVLGAGAIYFFSKGKGLLSILCGLMALGALLTAWTFFRSMLGLNWIQALAWILAPLGTVGLISIFGPDLANLASDLRGAVVGGSRRPRRRIRRK